MDIKIQSVKFDADKKLTDFIETKLKKIDRFAENIVSADVTLKLEKDPEHGNKTVILKLAVPGDELVAERRCKSFEEAVDQAIDALKKQLDKYKERLK